MGIPVTVSAQAPSPLTPASPTAASIAGLHNMIMIIAAVIFVIVEGLLLISVIRFRRRRDDEMPRQLYGSVPVEVAWTTAPAIIVLILAVLTFRTMRTIAEAPPEALHVQVTGHQWWWEFRYPDLGIVTANEMHIPVGQPLRFEIDSVDVIHSFWVPQLGGKKDAFPGRKTTMWFLADEPGQFQGQCAEFCGTQHGEMRFLVFADSPADFEAWVAQQTAGPAPITDPLAQEGEKIFAQSACVGCHRIEGTVAQGQTGPDLTHVGSRKTLVAGLLENTPENMAAWIQNPQQIKPGALMPDLGLDDQTVEALVAYLQSLK